MTISGTSSTFVGSQAPRTKHHVVVLRCCGRLMPSRANTEMPRPTSGSRWRVECWGQIQSFSSIFGQVLVEPNPQEPGHARTCQDQNRHGYWKACFPWNTDPKDSGSWRSSGGFQWMIPSGKRLHDGKSPWWMKKLSIWMAILNSKLLVITTE